MPRCFLDRYAVLTSGAATPTNGTRVGWPAATGQAEDAYVPLTWARWEVIHIALQVRRIAVDL